MFHDPEMECSCDGEGCVNSVYLPMDYNVRGYNLKDSVAEKMLKEIDWITVEGKHYCENCKDGFL